MAFAIDEINSNPSLLPNVTLGYSIYDTCARVGVGFHAALSLISGREEQFHLYESCVAPPPPMLGIVGPSTSISSIYISRMLGLYSVPMVSFLLKSTVAMAYFILFFILLTWLKYDDYIIHILIIHGLFCSLKDKLLLSSRNLVSSYCRCLDRWTTAQASQKGLSIS